MIKDRYTDAFEGRVLLLDGYRLAIQVVAGCKRIISPKPKRPYMLYLIRRAETVAAANAAVLVRSCSNWWWSCLLHAALRSSEDSGPQKPTTLRLSASLSATHPRVQATVGARESDAGSEVCSKKRIPLSTLSVEYIFHSALRRARRDYEI